MLVKQLNQLGEVRKRPGETVHLVDQYDINPAYPDVGQELLQGRSFKRTS